MLQAGPRRPHRGHQEEEVHGVPAGQVQPIRTRHPFTWPLYSPLIGQVPVHLQPGPVRPVHGGRGGGGRGRGRQVGLRAGREPGRGRHGVRAAGVRRARADQVGEAEVTRPEC